MKAVAFYICFIGFSLLCAILTYIILEKKFKKLSNSKLMSTTGGDINKVVGMITNDRISEIVPLADEMTKRAFIVIDDDSCQHAKKKLAADDEEEHWILVPDDINCDVDNSIKIVYAK